MPGSNVLQRWTADPAHRLRALVRQYRAVHYAGFTPGIHLGHPSPNLEFIVCLGHPLRLVSGPGDAAVPDSYRSLAAGLHTRPVLIVEDGRMDSVSLELTPRGARSLFGMPAAELANRAVTLDQVLDRDADELAERMAAAPDRPSCFAVLDEVLSRRIGQLADVDRSVEYVWQRILTSGGGVAIADLAEETGYSRRRLTRRFANEYGVTPKQAARIVRFERSRNLLRRQERAFRQRPQRGRPTLADIAASCGYYDQAHMAREWNDLGGGPPSRWLASEEVPFVQGSGTARTEASAS